MSRERVVVAMSGGVDSSVAALLVKEAGCDVVGLFLKNGVSAADHGARPGHQGCCSVEDAQDARRVADALGIDYYALDYGDEFARIIDGFVDDYAHGRTPSPCVLCNRWLKFGSLVGFAKKIGATAVATGHYARVDERPEGGGRRLLRAVDGAKDQSYFLAGLAPEQLTWCRFPVGGMTKPEVRERARAAGLRTAEKAESMEICFVPGGDYRDLVRERAPEAMREGAIVDAETGAEVGRHGGTGAFTIGQRRGIGVSAPEPRYVTALDPKRNLVVIGRREGLAREALTADRFVWTSREAPAAGVPVACKAQIRHRHTAVPAVAEALPLGRVRVRFERPVEAVAPGQAVALYDGDVVLGGGFIVEE